jgi:DNA-directed RNA polymerase subunit RPC12/RpoP
MGVVNKIKETFGITAEKHSYECNDCGNRFESTIASTALVQCVECGSDDLTKLTAPE